MSLMSFDCMVEMECFSGLDAWEEILPSHSPGSENSFGSLGSNDGALPNDYFNFHGSSSFPDNYDFKFRSDDIFDDLHITTCSPSINETSPTYTILNPSCLSDSNSSELTPMNPNQFPTFDSVFDSLHDEFPHFQLEPLVMKDVETSSINAPSPGSATNVITYPHLNSFDVKREIVPIKADPAIANKKQKREDFKPKSKLEKFQRGGKQVLLWQFLYYALQNPGDYGHTILWTDSSEGIFEFSSKNKDDLARAWGAVKNNKCKMTYPKLARALRKYIEGNKFLTKNKRKLQYKFNPDFLAQLRNNSGIRKLSDSDIKKMYENSRMQRR